MYRPVSMRLLCTCCVQFRNIESRIDMEPPNVSSRILAAIESLEERVAALSAVERRTAAKERCIPVPAVDVASTLTKPGHADQFKFCEEVRGIAEQALASFRFDEDSAQWEGDDDAVGGAVSAFQRILEAAERRQKLIRLADRSDLGWRVVQHYVADPIADDMEDEKRIRRATKAAEAELTASQDKKGEYIFCLIVASTFSAFSWHRNHQQPQLLFM